MTTEAILFALLRAEICAEPVDQETKEALSPEMLEALFELSRRHSLTHLTGQALSKLGVLGQDDISVKFQQRSMGAVTRYIQMSHAYHSICQTLEEAKIPFLPLKGAVLRGWYPEPWMRTCSDIDILVRLKDHEAAVKCLEEQCGCQYITESRHDVSLYFPRDIHIEIHHTLIEDTVSKAQEMVLSEVWDSAFLVEGFGYQYRMSDTMFRFYHYAHMTKHVKNGGCGIRPFLDLWVMNHRVDQNRTGEKKLLAQGGLRAFADAAEKLSEVWFSEAEPDSLSCILAQYILEGGASGTFKNKLTVKQVKKGGKLQYVLYRVFMPYDTLKEYYPVLKTHKWLLPFYQVVRWFRLLFKGGVKRSAQELKLNADMTREESTTVAELLAKLEI